VTPVEVGRSGDGLVPFSTAGTDLDPRWDDLLRDLNDAREAWRTNPLARRLISLVSSFVCGDGLTLSSERRDLGRFLKAFWEHEQNGLALRQFTWCEELSRSGELFVTLHMNPVDGMSYVRALPASSIDRIETAPGDYETELMFHEVVGLDDPDYPEGRTWLGHRSAAADVPVPSTAGPARPSAQDAVRYEPVCLHYTVNKPVGCVRGESDLAPVLQWLRRYDGWLRDRVRLNAAIHAFLWIVKVPTQLVMKRRAELASPPVPGSVMVVDRADEEWQAVAPSLHANDAGEDGRAIRWMIAAGGPGIGLVDLGEGEDSNLATAKAMAEQRARWMRARQQYFGFVLASAALTAYNRAVRAGKWSGQVRTLSDIRIGFPDISPADNAELGASAASVANALASVSGHGIGGERWRRLVVRTVLKFIGESVDEDELAKILTESEVVRRAEKAKPNGSHPSAIGAVAAEEKAKANGSHPGGSR